MAPGSVLQHLKRSVDADWNHAIAVRGAGRRNAFGIRRESRSLSLGSAEALHVEQAADGNRHDEHGRPVDTGGGAWVPLQSLHGPPDHADADAVDLRSVVRSTSPQFPAERHLQCSLLFEEKDVNRRHGRIARRRAPKIREQYAAIGGGSPIGKWTEAQGKMMEKHMDAMSPETAPHKAYTAFRYAAPMTEACVAQMKVFFFSCVSLHPQ